MENNMFEELLEMANEIVEGANNEEQISEEKSLEKGKANISTFLRNLSPLHYELLVHDMAVPLFGTLFDSETGALTPFGAVFAEDFSIISQDVPVYMSYFSKYSRAPSLNRLGEETMTPLSLFKFLQAIFESPGTLLPALQSEQPVLSSFIVIVFSNIRTLASKITFFDVYMEIKSIIDSVEAEDKTFITDIVEDALGEASLTSYIGRGTKYLSDEVRAYVIKETGATQQILDELQSKIGHTTNYLMFNTYLHQQANTYESTWTKSFSSTKEMFKDAEQNLISLSQKVGEMIAKSPPTGNIHFRIKVTWDQKFQNTQVSNSAFVEFTYLGYTIRASLSSGYAEFALPFYDKPQDISGTIYYISEKRKDTPFQVADANAYRVLYTFLISGVSKDYTKTEKFKKHGKLISILCGEVNIGAIIMKSDGVPINQSQISDDSVDLYVLLDYMTTKLVIDWTRTSGRMSLVPPQDFFIAIIDYSMRHAIPATTVFVLILRKLYEGWCDAESYLNAFTVLFMVTRNAIELCKSTETVKDTFNGIVNDMQKKVPLELYNRLKNPVRYEKSSLMSLLTLTGLIVDSDFRTLLDKFLKEAKSYFVKSIFVTLKPVESDSPTTDEAMVLWEYVKGYKRNTRNSTASTGSIEGLNDPKNFTFSVTGLADSMSIISQRSKFVKTYYENNVVPADFRTISGDTELFQTLSIYLVKVFLKLPIQLNDKALFKFVLAYREVWEFLKFGPEYSPYKLFFDIVLEWISSISGRLIEWTQRAVDIDTFEVDNDSEMTSTSIGDLMTMFSQSFSFVKSLKWKNKNIVEIILTYIASCDGCLRLYTKLLTYRIIKYFPKDIIVKTTDNQYVLSAMKQVESYNIESATPQQMYVMINDFSMIKPKWECFVQNFRPLIGAAPVPEHLLDPVPYVYDIMNVIPSLFSSLIEYEVYDYVSKRLWVENSSFKKIFIKKASKKVLHPEFSSRGSMFFNDLFEKCTQFIETRADQLVNHISKENMMSMLGGFFSGLDAGLMNLMISEEPIKHKRIVTIMNFIQDVLATLFEPMKDNFGVTASLYVKWAWRSKLLLDNINIEPLNSVTKMNTESGQRGLIFYILSRSYTNDRYSVYSAQQRDLTYIGMRFSSLL
ncbi:hypothetical protein TVAG_152230 [Trichomonas vaginalis G3]|uniref:MHD1 domain-containing protein n=1 Tax=Trichomonas vaginalis (strain ATCC PRA-98 / G3) TaxID=412133 RepID=A2F6Z9_TRIV3|nr:Munc13 (mammalian uncoordinated) homology domain-containing protein [Trichomonas vaginalis G3]EAX99304.1 hypothetical protein TVAG_152230 [Trichomonas vaginalis G3]KAI5500136.1 Munc13 (mammalian uncoordinated) homology domain-containing protein [Trichomonas vaginalis G3]|eukprot:XP_001312234.1 hypothetical protein [Trichomonas vaginalis G3]